MNEIVKKQVCHCVHCGNEAEMQIVCTLPDDHDTKTESEKMPSAETKRVKGSATCTQCGNEAEMWLDL